MEKSDEFPCLPEVTAAHRADLKAAIESMPASRWLGLEVVGFAPAGISRMELAIRPELTFDGRTVQGGVIGMLADYAGVSATACALSEGWFASTTGFEVHNIAPARGARLIAIGQAVSTSRRTGVSRADVYALSAGEWRLACVATTTCLPYERS